MAGHGHYRVEHALLSMIIVYELCYSINYYIVDYICAWL